MTAREEDEYQQALTASTTSRHHVNDDILVTPLLLNSLFAQTGQTRVLILLPASSNKADDNAGKFVITG